MYTFFEGDDFMVCLAAEEIDVLKRLQNERMLFPFNEIEPNVEQLKCSSSTKTFVIGIVRVEAKVRQKNCYVVLAEIDPHSKSSLSEKKNKIVYLKNWKKIYKEGLESSRSFIASEILNSTSAQRISCAKVPLDNSVINSCSEKVLKWARALLSMRVVNTLREEFSNEEYMLLPSSSQTHKGRNLIQKWR